MTRFRTKVCGLTRPRDAALATRLGADMIGMVFYPDSPRFVTQRAARAIVAELPPTVLRVGVFVDQSPMKMLSTAERLRLDIIQLHGVETAGTIRTLQKQGYRVIKSFHPVKASDYDRIARSPADLRLLDNRTGSLPGGTGRRFDWGVRPRRKIARLMLAGGINKDNLGEGVRLFAPLAVDISSGVEFRTGIKSPTKLREFFRVADRIRYGR